MAKKENMCGSTIKMFEIRVYTEPQEDMTEELPYL